MAFQFFSVKAIAYSDIPRKKTQEYKRSLTHSNTTPSLTHMHMQIIIIIVRKNINMDEFVRHCILLESFKQTQASLTQIPFCWVLTWIYCAQMDNGNCELAWGVWRGCIPHHTFCCIYGTGMAFPSFHYVSEMSKNNHILPQSVSILLIIWS